MSVEKAEPSVSYKKIWATKKLINPERKKSKGGRSPTSPLKASKHRKNEVPPLRLRFFFGPCLRRVENVCVKVDTYLSSNQKIHSDPQRRRYFQGHTPSLSWLLLLLLSSKIYQVSTIYYPHRTKGQGGSKSPSSSHPPPGCTAGC